jgi:hypothetical protein
MNAIHTPVVRFRQLVTVGAPGNGVNVWSIPPAAVTAPKEYVMHAVLLCQLKTLLVAVAFKAVAVANPVGPVTLYGVVSRTLAFAAMGRSKMSNASFLNTVPP